MDFLLVDFFADLVSIIDSRSLNSKITCTIKEHEGHLAYFSPSRSSSCIIVVSILMIILVYSRKAIF